ncbi:hypothetical protein CXT96_06680 [Akkermansia muciniphila]|nr:hypothetical protein CXT92_01440 [Akkermansia muciniphila]PNC91536.1 hypothetical protein CXT91_06680 [Akkermansia muciniphila]PND14049.1 hypothetical protein CXT96_06680 [Akkermansia muciniphila]
MNRFSEAGPSNTLLTASPPPSHTRNAILEKDGNTSPEVSFPDRIHGYPPVTCGPTKGKNGFSTGPRKEYCSGQNCISPPEHLPYNKKGMVRLRISLRGFPPLAVKCCRMRASVSPVNNKKSFRSF